MYALVLQGLLASFSSGVPTGLLDLTPFVGVICTSGSNSTAPEQAPAAPTAHAHLNCCILCSVPGLAATDSSGVLVSVPLIVSPLSLTVSTAPPLGDLTKHRSSQPRAPPYLG